MKTRKRNKPIVKAEFEALYRGYYERLINQTLGMVRNRTVAEDLVSEGVSNAWKHAQHFRGESQPYTWLSTIVKNAAMGWIRHKKKHVTLDLLEHQKYSLNDSVHQRLESDQTHANVRKALSRLPRIYRQALTDRFIDGFSCRYMANRRRLALGTVLSRVARGKTLMQQHLREEMKDREV